jgi:hypothetical protein
MSVVRTFVSREKIEPGQPCGHAGCLSHVTHPCESCGRVAGQEVTWLACDSCGALFWVIGDDAGGSDGCTCPDCAS